MGLRWDPKLESFYAMCDRDEWIADFSTLSADELAVSVRRLVDTRVDPEVRGRVTDACGEGVRRLAAHLAAGDPNR